MRMNKFCLVILFLLFPLLSWADSASSQLTQLLSGITNLQANFVQSVLNGNGGVLQQSSGQMIIQRPGKFRWEIQKPSKQLLIADGSKIWFYDVALEQVTLQKQQSTQGGTPALLLSGSAERLVQDYEITSLSPANAKVQSFKLVPKAKNNLFQSIELSFRDQTLQSMRLLDTLKQATVVNFSKVKTNPKISPETFHFVPPQGVDVVTQ